jgi:FkbM family methyltransferase
LDKLAGEFEYRTQLFQGKGWGSSTVHHEVRAAEKLLGHRPKLCVDVGGNLGHYTQALLSEFDSEVVIFEPSLKNYQVLQELFPAGERVSIENLALSNVDSVATLWADTEGSGLASLTKRRLDHFNIPFDFSEQVTTIRFENYWRDKLGSPEVDLLKLDIEGHELKALEGFGDALEHIDLIQFEFGGCNIDTRTYWQDFWYFFMKHSFDIFRLGPLGLRPIQRYSERDEFFTTTNYFAKKKTSSNP